VKVKSGPVMSVAFKFSLGEDMSRQVRSCQAWAGQGRVRSRTSHLRS